MRSRRVARRRLVRAPVSTAQPLSLVAELEAIAADGEHLTWPDFYAWLDELRAVAGERRRTA